MASKVTRISEAVWARAEGFRPTLAARNRTKIDDVDLLDYLVTSALDAEGVAPAPTPEAQADAQQ